MSTADTVVELSGVCKTFHQRQPAVRTRDVLRNLIRPTFREVPALVDVNLTIARGEIVAYAGPNGAGKSTTVKLLSGLLVPDRGTVRALGMDPARDRVRYVGRIGVVFGQRTELWWDQPVAATFAWKRVVWEIPRKRYERMLALVTELLDLGPFFRSLARELSLGQRMRADLGLALLHEPEILFLDEPTLGLDVLAKRKIVQFIRDLNREQRVTVMLTSHDMAELEQLAGRIVLIDRGRIAFDGDFDGLRRPGLKPGSGADRRHLILTTANGAVPVLEGADLVKSEAGGSGPSTRHEYVFDASRVTITALLDQAAAQTSLVDVETHRAPIDEVIASIYERWAGDGTGRADGRPPGATGATKDR